jgi:hypothetical protein
MHSEWYGMGAETIEVWRTSGQVAFPLTRQIEVAIERGIIGRMACCRFDNTLTFVADNKMVYRLNGYTPLKISHDGIDVAIEDTPDPTDIIATSYAQDGHEFFGIRSMSGNWSFWYDAATQLWSERATYDGALNNPWDIGYTINAYGKAFGGSVSTANVFEFDVKTYADNGTAIVREAVSPILSYGPVPFTMWLLQLDFVTGVGLNSGQGSDPQVMLSFSDDGGRTFSQEILGSLGSIGAYKTPVNFEQLGQTRHGRILKIKTSDPVFSSLMGAYADIELDAA